MKYITLNNGIQMPMLGYGVYQIPNSQTKECVLEALKVGYRLIDTAQYYGNERGVGDAIKASGIPRKEIFITTKLKSNHNVERLIEQSLADLQTDYIDLYLVHWPDPNVPLAETIGALGELKKQSYHDVLQTAYSSGLGPICRRRKGTGIGGTLSVWIPLCGGENNNDEIAP